MNSKSLILIVQTFFNKNENKSNGIVCVWFEMNWIKSMVYKVIQPFKMILISQFTNLVSAILLI